MNKFDLTFFAKYVSEGHEIKDVVHSHPVNILFSLLIKIGGLVLIPVVFYYNSNRIQDLLPFMFLEIYLILIYIKLVYDIFDWYNDVWIITNEGVISLNRSFMKSSSDTINFQNIEGVGVDQSGPLDKVCRMGNLQIHKVGDGTIDLYGAMSPYKALNLIESLTGEKEEDQESNKFDMIMDALSGVVSDYIHEGKQLEKKKVEKKDIMNKIREIEGTIDLR